MRLHSNILTARDIYEATPADVIATVTTHGSRKRASAFEISLAGFGERHTRKKNSGQYGAGDEKAATWDDWGVVLARLFEIDPNMTATYYKDRADFYEQTRKHQQPGSRAPWLENEAPPATWPDDAQEAADAERLEQKRQKRIRAEARALQARAERLLKQV